MRTRSGLVFMGVIAATIGCFSGSAAAQKKVYLNPSNQTGNAVSGGGNEAQYALICANLAKPILTGAGFSVVVDQDFTNAPKNANSWGADIFVSMHTNAGGGHGTEVLYKTTGGKALADKVLAGLLAALGYQSRGLKLRTDLHVLNNTNMYACLTEAVFHDCTAASGYTGHPPSESSFLRSTAGQQKIAAGTASGVCAYFGKTCSGSTTTKGWLKGVVYKNPTLTDRIAGATVTLNTGASATTDSNGYWAFELAPGSYTATATKTGYAPGSSTRTVVAGQEVWGSIGLNPATPPKDSGPDKPGAKLDRGGAEQGPSVDGPSGQDGKAADDNGLVEGGPAPFTSIDEGCGCAVEGTGRGPWLMLLGWVVLVRIRGRARRSARNL